MVSKAISIFVLCAAFSQYAEGQGTGNAVAKFAYGGVANRGPAVTIRGPAAAPVNQPMAVLNTLAKLEDESQEIEVVQQRLRARIDKLSQVHVKDSQDGFGFNAGLIASIGFATFIGVVAVRQSMGQGQQDTVSTTDSRGGPLRAHARFRRSVVRASLAEEKPVTMIDILTSGLASISRLPYGTDVAEERSGRAFEQDQTTKLTLYEFEGCPFCRRVREVVTYLDLCITIKPCGQGSRHRAEVVAASGRERPTYPYLVDEGVTPAIAMFESADICNYLIRTYGGPDVPLPPPTGYFLTSTLISGWVPSLFRFGRGTSVEERVRGKPPPVNNLILYSYDGNQFCRFVREVLCELDLPYELRSTGKGSPRRAELQALSGKTTAPYIVDPNSGVSMGESADIVKYLWTQYG